MLIRLIALLLVLTPSFSAADTGLYVGLNSTEFRATEPIAGFDFKPTIGASVGIFHVFVLPLPFLLRTGVGLATRGVEVDIGTSSTSKNTVITLEAPATAMYEFSEMFAVYGGLNFMYQLDAGCKPNAGYCSDGSVDFFQEFVLGINYFFNFTQGMELEYSTLLNKIENDIVWDTITLRYLYSFD